MASLSAKDPFHHRGRHFNPDMKKHGLENPTEPHAARHAELHRQSERHGKGYLSKTRASTLKDGEHALHLRPGAGLALVVHAKADDLKTDPAGNAGDRIACGLIAK